MWELCVLFLAIRLALLITPRYHGGWLAPNIYFLGHAGCVQVNGIRIAGASGIYKMHDFKLGESYSYDPSITQSVVGNHEKVPYDASSIRSIYHIREYNVRRLSLVCLSSFFLFPV
jgi:lariat debranching enzyme